MQTIEAEGHQWPLDTFIDSHRYQRTASETPAIVRSDWPVSCVTKDCRIIERPAGHAPWHDVIAYRAPDLSSRLAECPACGDVAEIASSLLVNEDGTLILDCPACGHDNFEDYW
ncbi:hypothetical protein [uncultured Croceicoccus sp.]|uniref:hypothetical protein n=1 Tax=uncultured Croceicoccus sp. TaxID=1295329 RepID=UPI002604E225|nr:hypothetical protein [uncultured Croceicoccus sp.]